MRPVTINPYNVPAALQEIERASHDGDIVEIAQNFTFSGTVTSMMVLNMGAAASASNCAAVLATLLQIMQRGGLNRTT